MPQFWARAPGFEFCSWKRITWAAPASIEGVTVAGDQIRQTLEAQGVSIKLNEKPDLPPPETWTERPVLKLSDGTIVSPGLTLIATGRKPNVEELSLESIGIAADGSSP